MAPYDLMNIALLVERMRQNSDRWYTAEPEEQASLAEENRALAQQLNHLLPVQVMYNPDGGTWRLGSVDGPLLYDLY